MNCPLLDPELPVQQKSQLQNSESNRNYCTKLGSMIVKLLSNSNLVLMSQAPFAWCHSHEGFPVSELFSNNLNEHLSQATTCPVSTFKALQQRVGSASQAFWRQFVGKIPRHQKAKKQEDVNTSFYS
jgi:hypothetical protein